jgi:hypothetical protein
LLRRGDFTLPASAVSLGACSTSPATTTSAQGTAVASPSPQASAIAAIVRVTKGGKVVTTQAVGPSMTGVPATL